MARKAIILALALCVGAAGCGREAREPGSSAPKEIAATPGATAAPGPTLQAVRQRGRINCGVPEEREGFASRDVLGFRGFDVDVCRAVAAAVFGDARRVRLFPLASEDRLMALQAERVDLLPRGGLSFTRDVGRGLDFVTVSFHDDQAFLTARSRAETTLEALGGLRVCVLAASTSELSLVEHYQSASARPRTVVADSEAEAVERYVSGQCEALAGDRSLLASIRAGLRDPDAHVILEEGIGHEPQGPIVRQGDDQWDDIVRWTVYAMILAEQLGVTSRTVEDARRDAQGETARLLAGDGLGPMLQLQDDWAFQVIRQVGNYGEVFDRRLGPDSGLKLERGRNALVSADPPGLLFAPPMR